MPSLVYCLQVIKSGKLLFTGEAAVDLRNSFGSSETLFV
jgi:hypothetical protein